MPKLVRLLRRPGARLNRIFLDPDQLRWNTEKTHVRNLFWNPRWFTKRIVGVGVIPRTTEASNGTGKSGISLERLRSRNKSCSDRGPSTTLVKTRLSRYLRQVCGSPKSTATRLDCSKGAGRFSYTSLRRHFPHVSGLTAHQRVRRDWRAAACPVLQ